MNHVCFVFFCLFVFNLFLNLFFSIYLSIFIFFILFYICFYPLLMYWQSGLCTSFNPGASLRHLAAANRGPRNPTKYPANQSALRKAQPEQTTAGPQDEACHRFALIKTTVLKVWENKSSPLSSSEKSHYVVTVGSCRRQKTQSLSGAVAMHHDAINHTCLEIMQTVELRFFCKSKQKLEGKFLGFHLLINIHVLVLFCFSLLAKAKIIWKNSTKRHFSPVKM